jgi:hypothetical protein
MYTIEAYVVWALLPVFFMAVLFTIAVVVLALDAGLQRVLQITQKPLVHATHSLAEQPAVSALLHRGVRTQHP